jgi:hypothetical protein
MSTQAKIHCFNCDCTYYAYWDGIDKNKIINCPHCDATMDETMWNSLINAMGAVHDLNYHFVKYNSERNEDLFEVNIENFHVPSEKFRDLY